MEKYKAGVAWVAKTTVRLGSLGLTGPRRVVIFTIMEGDRLKSAKGKGKSQEKPGTSFWVPPPSEAVWDTLNSPNHNV